MFEPKEIDMKRVENIKSLLKLEKLTQAKLADMIGMSPENLNRILRLRHPLTTATAESIHVAFNKKYRLEWIQGYSPYMTEEELDIENMKQWEFKHRAVDSLKMLISSNPEETKKLLQLMDEGVDIRKLKTRDIVGDE